MAAGTAAARAALLTAASGATRPTLLTTASGISRHTTLILHRVPASELEAALAGALGERGDAPVV
jgi:hypothetical protein